MFPFIIILSVVILILLIIHIKQKLKIKRRKEVISKPFPEKWKKILNDNIELYRMMPDKFKEQLHNDIKIFLDEKSFEGCGGLEITDEIRVTIAGEACMLLLNKKSDDFPKLHSILVYPHPYVAKSYTSIGGQFAEIPSARAGESWTGGDVVLAWDRVKYGALNGKDGDNVVLHEFAHQLDQEDGAADGIPNINNPKRYSEWCKIFGKEYSLLKNKVEHHKKTLMDAYGATNPAEFFAVATETFFEKPKQMKKNEPELYDELKDFYRLDPAAWN